MSYIDKNGLSTSLNEHERQILIETKYDVLLSLLLLLFSFSRCYYLFTFMLCGDNQDYVRRIEL